MARLVAGRSFGILQPSLKEWLTAGKVPILNKRST
jgi:hypothetical protein